MAASLASLVTCDVCFEVFKEPKSLVCRHTFCSPCVDKINMDNQVECPMCKRKSKLIDIEPDFRTSVLVKSYIAQEKADKGNGQNKEDKCLLFAKTRKFCEVCSSEENAIICKCKECNRFLCKECKISHNENALYSNHTVTPTVSLAAEAKHSLLELVTEVKEKGKLCSNIQEVINKSSQQWILSEKDAVAAINQSEARLIGAIKKHHEDLRQEVHNKSEQLRHTHKKLLVKTQYRTLDLQNKVSSLLNLIENCEDCTLADTGEEIREEIYEGLAEDIQIPKEMQEEVKIQVLEGEPFDKTKSTKLSIFPWKERMDDKTDFCTKDYSEIAKHDFKQEKVVDVPGKTIIEYMFMFQNKLICVTYNQIHTYDKDLKLEKSVTLELVTYTKAVMPINEGNYFITACATTGLHLHDKVGKHLQRISLGSFVSVFVINNKIHAFECEKKELVIYKQTSKIMEKIGSIKYPDVSTNSDNKLLPLLNKLFMSYITYQVGCIYQCDFAGKLLHTFGFYGQLKTEGEKQLNAGKLCYPYVCCADDKRNVIVADRCNDRLQLCTDTGEWSVILLRGEPHLEKPVFAVVSDDGRCIWVAEAHGRIKMYKTTILPQLTF